VAQLRHPVELYQFSEWHLLELPHTLARIDVAWRSTPMKRGA
jgi:hypothetical protein